MPQNRPQTHEARAFIPLDIAVVTISDSRTPEQDRSGQLLEDLLTSNGHRCARRILIPDDKIQIQNQLSALIAQPEISVIVTTGGTGVTGRDQTPEAIRAIIDKEIEGFGELFRAISREKIGTSALQSRALAGVAQETYIFALPGSPSACRDGWNEILKFQLDYRHKPCNFVELLPRLKE